MSYFLLLFTCYSIQRGIEKQENGNRRLYATISSPQDLVARIVIAKLVVINEFLSEENKQYV